MSAADEYLLAKRALGLRIVELRVTKGLTQEELAAAAGYSNRQMQRLEAGSATPNIKKLVDVAGALGVALRDLFAHPSPTVKRRPGNPSRPRRTR